MRTAASAGLSALRIIEDEATRGRGEKILLRAGRDAAVYVLNKKRSELAEIEGRYGVSIEISIDEGFEGAKMTVESSGPRPVPAERPAPVVETPEEEEEELEAALVGAEGDEDEEAETADERTGRRRKRRRRGGRGRRRNQEAMIPADELPPRMEEAEVAEQPVEAAAVETEQPEAEEKPKKGRRRRKPMGKEPSDVEGATVEPDSSPMVERPIDEEPPIAETEAPAEPQPKPKRRRSRKTTVDVPEPAPPEAPPAETADETAGEAKPKRRTRKPKKEDLAGAEEAGAPQTPMADNDPNGEEANSEPRRGWWQRTFG